MLPPLFPFKRTYCHWEACHNRLTMQSSQSVCGRNLPIWHWRGPSSLQDTSCTFRNPTLPRLLFASLPSLAPSTRLLPNLPLSHFLLLLYCKTPLGPFSFTSKATFRTFCSLTTVNQPIWSSSTGMGPQEMVWLGLFAFKPEGTWGRTREGGQDAKRARVYNGPQIRFIKSMT